MNEHVESVPFSCLLANGSIVEIAAEGAEWDLEPVVDNDYAKEFGLRNEAPMFVFGQLTFEERPTRIGTRSVSLTMHRVAPGTPAIPRRTYRRSRRAWYFISWRSEEALLRELQRRFRSWFSLGIVCYAVSGYLLMTHYPSFQRVLFARLERLVWHGSLPR
jgi:hypothetical protein